MKNLAKIFMGVVLLAGVTSCVQDTTVDVGGFKPTQTISISMGDVTKTALGEKDELSGKYPLYWSAGDQVSINGVASNALAEDFVQNKVAQFEFSGDLGSTPYKVSYPATKTPGSVVFAAVQTHTEGTFSAGAAPMYGESNSLQIEMQHLVGVLKLPIVGEEGVTLKRVDVMAADATTRLAGAYNVEIVEGVAVATPSDTATNRITYNCEGLALSATPQVLHIAVPAGVYDALALIITAADGSAMRLKVKAPEAKPIAPGVVREYSPITFADNDPTFLIEDSESLIEFKTLCEEGRFIYTGARVANNFTFEGEWSPVSGFVNDLEFDGGDFTITGLPNALFEKANGFIHNVKLNSTVELSDENAHHGLLANQFSGTISDCEVSGSIEHTALKGTADVAGVVGAASGKISFTNVVNKASVKATFVQDATPKLAGILATSSATGALEFINCSNSGAIETIATSGVTTKATHIGGIFGFVDDYAGTIFVKGCSNSGNITSNHDVTGGELLVGGIWGTNQSPVTTELDNEAYNTNSGDITINGTGTSSIHIGGCIGRIEKANTMAKHFKNLEDAEIVVNAQNPVRMGLGGVVGHQNITTSTVEDCYNFGTVRYNGTMEGATAGYYSPTIGGIIGYMNQANHTVKNCHNYGDVSCTSTATFNRFKIGGVLGYSEGANLTIENCSNNHDLTFDGTTGGVFYAGGVVGHTDKAITAKDLVNNNKITINGQGGSGGHVGGVYGQIGETNSKCSGFVNNGEIIVNTEVTSKFLAAGGVIGSCAATADDITNKGKVTFDCSSVTELYVGGVIASLTNAASGLLNENEVSFTGAAGSVLYAGGVVGNTSAAISLAEGKTYAAKNSGVVTFGGASTAEYYAGGVVGRNTVAQTTVLENAGNLSFTGAAGTSPYVGGVIGYTSGDIAPAEGKEVAAKNSAETLTIGGTSASYFFFGGVIGQVRIADVSGLTNESDITVTHVCSSSSTDTMYHVGGVIGLDICADGLFRQILDRTIFTNANTLKNTGNLTYNGKTASTTANVDIGGIFGASNGVNCDGLYNTGVITLGSELKTKDGGMINVGGCSGQPYSGKMNNFYNGDADDPTHEKGKIVLASKSKCHIHAGGFGGYVTNYNDGNTNHYNYGNIETTEDFTMKASRLRLGGLYGWYYNTTVIGAHNSGNIILSSTAADATNQLYIGGIGGRVSGGSAHYDDMSNSGSIYIDIICTGARCIGGIFATQETAGRNISNTHSTGNITVTSRTAHDGTFVGGIVANPTKTTTITESSVNCTVSTALGTAGMAVGIAYGGVATVTNTSFDGFIQRAGAAEPLDLTDGNFFDYIYSDAWGGESDYAGNTGFEFNGGGGID